MPIEGSHTIHWIPIHLILSDNEDLNVGRVGELGHPGSWLLHRASERPDYRLKVGTRDSPSCY